MKRILKTALLSVVMSAFCVCLCSCRFISELKETHAFYSDETKTQIILGQNTYKILSNVPEEATVFGDFSNSGHVTEKDVPVLLSFFYGGDINIRADGTIIMVTYFDDKYNYYDQYYCRDDLYDEINDTFENPEFNSYCVEHYDENSNSVPIPMGSKAVKEMADIIDNTIPDKKQRDIASFVKIYRCDKNMVIGQEALELCVTEDDEYCFISYDIHYNAIYYTIPQEKVDLFADYIQKDSDEFFGY